jgi:predicted ATPase/KaiC/GvpD/RAD55 family RecA-like ATPase
MNALKEAVYRAVHGEGGLVFVYGEAGIGKTRLLRELGAYAQSRGVQVLHGRCPGLFRMDGVPPYVIWKEVIKDYLETCIPEQLYRVIGYYPAEVAKLVPELSQKLRTLPPSFPISPEQEQNRLFEAVSQFITNLSREIPLLVILDDLQWTDPSSLLLLHYLARGVQKTSLLLLGAYRSTDVDAKHPLSPILAELNRERLPQFVPLKRMSMDDISEMIKNILEQEDIPQEFCRMVYEKTRGNPFFAEEVTKSLKEEDVIYREENKWKIKEVSRIEFPETIKSVIKARIGRLDYGCQNVLTLASFAGNDFGFEALCAVTGIEENKLLELLERILKTGLIKEKVTRGEDVYCFADVIVRDVVHEEVSHLRHNRLHGTVGSALEKAYAKKIDEHLGELAYHFLESGDEDKALNYFLKAGEKSQNTYAYDEAFSYLSHALNLLGEEDGSVDERTQITERLGDIKNWTGQIDAGLEYWDRALIMWTQLGDKKSVARLHAKMAHAFWFVAGDRKKASEHHQMALEILEKEPENAELANVYEDIGHRLWRSGEPEASSWIKKALALAEKLGDSRALAECYNDLAAFSSEIEEVKKCSEQGLKTALESNSLEVALRSYSTLCAAYRLGTAEPQKALEIVQKGLELAKKVGDLHLLAYLDQNLAFCYFDMGETQKSLSTYEDGLALVKRTRNASFTPWLLSDIGECYLWLGEWDKCVQYSTEAIDLAKKTGESLPSANANLVLGELSMEREDYEEAEKRFNESNRLFEKARIPVFQIVGTHPALSRLYLKKGEIEKAKELIERTYELAAKSKGPRHIARAEMFKGMLFREQKDWEQSIQHFEKSLQTYKDLNAQKWYVPNLANLLFEYGLMYLKRNDHGDKQKASALLNQALEMFQKMGAKKDIEKTEAKIALIETGKEVSKPKPIELVSTGYADLDKLLCGGLPSGYSVILASPSCDERDLLIKSFLETGAKKGEVTFYLTIDPGGAKAFAEEYPSNFYLIVCNPQADVIVEDAPNVIKLKGVENLTEIGIALTSAIRRAESVLKGSKRLCIGFVSDVLLQHHNVQTRRWLAGLIPELRSAGFTTLAVMDPGMHPSQDVQAVLDLFEGEIDIFKKETEKGPSRKYLKIQKMSNQRYLDNELPLKREEQK